MDMLAGVELAVRLAFATVPQMSTAELARLQQQPAGELIVLDVRTPAEFAVSHIPGARRFEGPAAAFDPPQTAATVVLYCSVGWRSSELAQQLAAHHSARAPQVRFVNLSGSLFRWALEGRPLVNAAGATQNVHGFSAFWARLLPRERVVL